MGDEGASSGGPHSASRTDAPPRTGDVEMARSNRDVTVGLSGTCAAVLTFALFFLFDRARSGEANETLFQITLADLVLSEALLGYGGTCYAWQVAALRKNRRADALEQWGDSFLGLGMLALSLAPALILFTVNLTVVGWIAFATWIAIPVAIIWRSRLRSEIPAPGNRS